MDMLGNSKGVVKVCEDFGGRHQVIWSMGVLTLCHCRGERGQARMEGSGGLT